MIKTKNLFVKTLTLFSDDLKYFSKKRKASNEDDLCQVTTNL